MKKKVLLGLVAMLSICLTGCTEEMQATSSVKLTAPHEVQPWQASDIMNEAPAVTTVEEVVLGEFTDEELKIRATEVQSDVSASISLLGISVVSDGDGTAEDTEVKGITAIIKPGKEYEVTAQVLIDLPISSAELMEVDLCIPGLVEAESFKSFTTELCVDGEVVVQDEFSVGSLAYDLVLEYVPNSYKLCQVTGKGGAAGYVGSEDVTWEQDAGGTSRLGYPVDVSAEQGMTEYLLSCHVTAAVTSGQEKLMEEHAKNPIELEIVGISQSHTMKDGTALGGANAALEDVLRSNYLLPETLMVAKDLTDDQAENEGFYVVAEVTLPDWALEEASQNGLIVNQYSYLYGGRDAYVLTVELDGYPDNYTARDAVEIVPNKDGAKFYVMGIPSGSLLIWDVPETQATPPKYIDEVSYRSCTYDGKRCCQVVSQVIAPEQVTVTEGHFYFTLGYSISLVE